jgi:light-regulated signal transduction histidine kinase (bacteriophytochrome)
VAIPQTFAQIVSLACHDLRTPLATVHGFARTIDRLEPLQERTRRYVGLMAEGSGQMAELLERLALVARIERGSYDPALQTVDSLELARSAAGLVGNGDVAVAGEGAAVAVDVGATELSIAAFCAGAIRHGDADGLDCEVSGPRLEITPVNEQSGPILLGDELRDFGAVAARMQVEALGGAVSVEAGSLRVELPAT